MNLQHARMVAGKLANTYNTKSFFSGVDIGPTTDGKGIVLLLYGKSKPYEKIPEQYEGYDVIFIDESETK
jgi:hypothetical protein